MSLFKKLVLIYFLGSMMLAGVGWIQESVFDKPFWFYLTIYTVIFGVIPSAMIWIILAFIERSSRD